ncbi:MAG: hypothetical protein WC686_05070 [Candidatus Shapirobacteria bacterium]|jgi:hypothetical protein
MAEVGDLKEIRTAVPEEVRRFFNSGSQIEVLPGGEYLVETVLEDGREINGKQVKGGQHLTMVLSPRCDIFTGVDVNEEMRLGNYIEGYGLMSMKVEGEEYLQETDQMYFVHLDFINEDEEELCSGFFEARDIMEIDDSCTYCLLGGMRTADNVVGLIHEQGHLNRGVETARILSKPLEELNRQMEERRSRQRRSIMNSISRSSRAINHERREILPSIEEQETTLALLMEERDADIEALKIIQESRQRGIDFFPTDSELISVKELMRDAIRWKCRSWVPEIVEAMGDRVNQVFDFD